MADDDEDYYIPLVDQHVFGAGIKRKGIAFIPAAPLQSTLPVTEGQGASSAADKYLSIVMRKKDSNTSKLESVEAANILTAKPTTCAVCNQQLGSGDRVATDAHESSIAHQVCLQHSHPPSHLDREHVGVRYMTAYGWDPDSRKGLGARGEGIRIPINAKEKKDTAGLREQDDDEDIKSKKKSRNKTVEKTSAPLNAKEVRKREVEAKKRAERLRASFYGPDLEKYLGPEESQSFDMSAFRRC